MTSRERIIAAIEHREPDRIPIDIGGSIMTGISVFAMPALREALGLPQKKPRANELFQMLGEVEADVIEACDIDVLPIEPETMFYDIPRRRYKEWTHSSGFEMLVPGAFEVERDAEGSYLLHESGDASKPVVARMPENGYYFDNVQSESLSLDYTPPPLSELEKDLRAPLSNDELDYLATRAKKLRPTDKALFLGNWLKLGPPSIGNTPDWLCLLVSDRSYVENLFSIRIEGDLRKLEQLNEYLGDSIDIIGIDGFDFGTQRAALFDTEIFEYAHEPYYRAILGWIQEHTSWKTWKHSCGAVGAFLPALIDCGLDCINPVQISAAGMEPERLKREFGDKITFWGGGIDTQHTLPFGTPDEVYTETTRLLRTFGPGGGFVFNTVHNIQANSPAENIKAMLSAVRDNGGYPLSPAT